MKKVLIPTKLDGIAAKILKDNGGYEVIQNSVTPLADLIAEHPDTFALIVRSEPVTEEIMRALPSLRVVVRAGAGFNTIDVKAARKLKIDVMNTPGANANAVAEEVIALILADARHLASADASMRRGAWEKARFMGRELAGKTVGIVGLGHIGRLVAKRLEGFECRLLGYDPLVPGDRARQFGISVVDLDTLFRESDYITLHVPENNETRGMVGERLFGLMKKGATLVNCARASIVDEDALRAVKKQKELRFLTDVYPEDGPGMKSVSDLADLMVPHIGASTYEANETAARRASQQLIDLVERGVTSYIVNRDVPCGLDETFCSLAFTLGTLSRGLVGRHLPISQIETSFYGSMAPFKQWLLLSLLSGIWDDIDRSADVEIALAQLRDHGVKYTDREVDPSKHFENSMTVDLLSIAGGKEVRRVSVRGTIAEGVFMISRINQFDRLYWVPRGVALFFQYEDRPGVIAVISKCLAEAGINIEDMRNPHDHDSGESLAILSVNTAVSDDLLKKIAQETRSTMAHALTV